MAKSEFFHRDVSLPPGLTIAEIGRAIDYIERELADFADLYDEQANVFSGLVGIFGTRALDAVSSYEKHRHATTAQQRFPDLRRRGSGPTPSARESLESKGSKRAWAIQSHYDHPGWYIVWRYLVDPTQSIERGKPIIIWRVDVVFLEKVDWKYEGSTAGESGGGRTHPFGVSTPATKLKDRAVYRRTDIVIRRGKPVPANGHGANRS